MAPLQFEARYYAKREVMEKLPLLKSNVLIDICKIMLCKMAESSQCFSESRPSYHLIDYLVKPNFTDLDLLFNYVCL